MLSRDDVFPSELPAFDKLLLDSTGALWVRESVVLGEPSANWLVLSPMGIPLGRVSMPSEFAPMHIALGSIAGVWTDSLGLEQVRVYTLRRAR